MQHPSGPSSTFRIADDGEVRGTPNASSRDGDWRTTLAENAVSRSLPAWLHRHDASSGPPGGAALAAYLRIDRLRSSSREF